MPSDPESAFLSALQEAKLAETAVVEEGSKDVEKGSPSIPPTSGVTRSNIWQHPDAHPIVLDFALLNKYGPEWLEWEPETVQLAISQDFGTSGLSDLNLAKIQACKTLHLVDSFWERWEVYLWCTMPFNSEFPDFRLMQVPAVGQVLVSCDIAARIRDDVAWSEEVKEFIAAVYKHDDIFLPLPPADFITLPAPEIIDAAALAREWPKVRASGRTPTGGTIQDEQLRRLLSVNDYLEESRTRLQKQLALHV